MEASPSALPWWLATTACSLPAAASSIPNSLLAFLFLSPCPQRALVASLDLVFLVAALAAVTLRLCRRRNDDDDFTPLDHLGGLDDDDDRAQREPLLPKPSTPTTTDEAAAAPSPLRFRQGLALAASGAQAAAALVLLLLSLLLRRRDSEGRTTATDCAFLAAHAAAHLAAAWAVVAAERSVHRPPLHLSLFWLATSASAAVFAGCAAARYALAAAPLVPDDPLALAWLATSLPLLYLSLTTPTTAAAAGELPVEETYATASWLSLATFAWVNPLIAKCFQSPLTADQVPPLAPPDSADAAHALFASNWPSPSSSSSNPHHPVATALLRSFWPQLLLTAILGLTHLSVMYVGPSLVDRFVTFIQHDGDGDGDFTDGLRLVAFLVAGKAAETLASHHYEFHGQKLGMRVHAALLAAVYRKSLSRRRRSAAGSLVNYMEVDAQEVSDVAHRLHDLWLTPLEITLALALLYAHLGPPVLAAVAAIAAATVAVALANARGFEYQSMLLGARDERIKAITQLLGNMRVVKLQAWEETVFGEKVRRLREEEVGWLGRSAFFMCANTVVLWSGPLAMAVLVFGACVAAGVELDAGKVFTATAFFQMLEGPMQSFPEAIAAVTQAAVSLARLDRYLLDKEIDGDAVERVEDDDGGVEDGAVVVEVRDGVFAWDVRGTKKQSSEEGDSEDGESEEEEGDVEETPVPAVLETVLKGIEVEVRKGELAAVVGMVGSDQTAGKTCDSKRKIKRVTERFTGIN